MRRGWARDLRAQRSRTHLRVSAELVLAAATRTAHAALAGIAVGLDGNGPLSCDAAVRCSSSNVYAPSGTTYRISRRERTIALEYASRAACMAHRCRRLMPSTMTADDSRSRLATMKDYGVVDSGRGLRARFQRPTPELPWRSGGSAAPFGAGDVCSTKTSPLQNSTEQELRPVSRIRRQRSARF